MSGAMMPDTGGATRSQSRGRERARRPLRRCVYMRRVAAASVHVCHCSDPRLACRRGDIGCCCISSHVRRTRALASCGMFLRLFNVLSVLRGIPRLSFPDATVHSLRRITVMGMWYALKRAWSSWTSLERHGESLFVNVFRVCVFVYLFLFLLFFCACVGVGATAYKRGIGEPPRLGERGVSVCPVAFRASPRRKEQFVFVLLTYSSSWVVNGHRARESTRGTYVGVSGALGRADRGPSVRRGGPPGSSLLCEGVGRHEDHLRWGSM